MSLLKILSGCDPEVKKKSAENLDNSDKQN